MNQHSAFVLQVTGGDIYIGFSHDICNNVAFLLTLIYIYKESAVLWN